MKYILEESMEFYINKVLLLWKRELLRSYKAFNITPEQWSILTSLLVQDGITQTELAHKTSKDLPTVTRILKKLESKDLIKRRSDANDHRTSIVYITEKGKHVQNQINPIAEKISEKALKDVSKEELEMVKRVFNQIYNNLQE